MSLQKPKPKTCKHCRSEFIPWSTTQRACSAKCAIAIENEKKRKKFDAETKRRKVGIRTVSDWTKRVQKPFNAFIRARDWDKPCISCGKFESEPFNGQLWDAGHFLPTSTHPEMRFNELNCHRQHSRCNRGAAKSGRNDRSVSAQYRINLIDRIGLPLVEWLESPHKPLQARADELEALERYYKQRAKDAERYAKIAQSGHN